LKRICYFLILILVPLDALADPYVYLSLCDIYRIPLAGHENKPEKILACGEGPARGICVGIAENADAGKLFLLMETERPKGPDETAEIIEMGLCDSTKMSVCHIAGLSNFSGGEAIYREKEETLIASADAKPMEGGAAIDMKEHRLITSFAYGLGWWPGPHCRIFYDDLEQKGFGIHLTSRDLRGGDKRLEAEVDPTPYFPVMLAGFPAADRFWFILENAHGAEGANSFAVFSVAQGAQPRKEYEHSGVFIGLSAKNRICYKIKVTSELAIFDPQNTSDDKTLTSLKTPDMGLESLSSSSDEVAFIPAPDDKAFLFLRDGGEGGSLQSCVFDIVKKVWGQKNTIPMGGVRATLAVDVPRDAPTTTVTPSK
jgi:hypothetical protein